MLLLHGFPASSFMFRELIPRLANDYRVIAPDLPGFGFTEVPAERKYVYSFDRLAATLNAFTQALKIRRFALYVFDYGAPTGFRLAMAHPDRVTAIVSQNGNAYEEGLGDAWAPIRKYWAAPTPENREVLRKNILTLEATRWQYTHGVANPESIPPESYTLDAALLERPGNKDIQLDLFRDYVSNVELYPAFQDYFRKANPPLLAIWGQNDPFFLPAGAEAFRKDIPNAQVQFLDTGHFAIETHVVEIAAAMKEFFDANRISSRTDGASRRFFCVERDNRARAERPANDGTVKAELTPGVETEYQGGAPGCALQNLVNKGERRCLEAFRMESQSRCLYRSWVSSQ